MSISALLTQYGDRYLQALLTTWKLTAFSFLGAFLIGILITVLRVCPVKPLLQIRNKNAIDKIRKRDVETMKEIEGIITKWKAEHGLD